MSDLLGMEPARIERLCSRDSVRALPTRPNRLVCDGCHTSDNRSSVISHTGPRRRIDRIRAANRKRANRCITTQVTIGMTGKRPNRNMLTWRLRGSLPG